MEHEAKEIEKSKSGRHGYKKRNANERRRKRQAGGDAGLGNKSGGAAPRRDRMPQRGNGKRIEGKALRSERISEKHAISQCINMHKRAKTLINVEVFVDNKAHVPHETRTQRNALPCTACGNRGSRKRQDGASNGGSAAKAAADLAEGARKGREKRAEAECRRAAER